MSDGDLTPDQLPCPPLPEADGSTRDVYVVFSGYGPAGPGYYLVTLAELVDDGGTHYWPRLVWDGDAWVQPDEDWFEQNFPVHPRIRDTWGPWRGAPTT